MSEIDEFASKLFEEAKRFFEKGQESASNEERDANLHASINLAFCALEAHINSVADDFLSRSEFNVLEQSILSEKDYELKSGQFVLSGRRKIYRLEERVEFLLTYFTKQPIDKNAQWWSHFKEAINMRNELTHPKSIPSIDVAVVKRALISILETLNNLYMSVYKKEYPRYKRGLGSTLTF